MAAGMSRTTPSCWYRPCHWLLAAHLRLLADFPRGGTGACWSAADCTVRTTSTITVLTIILDETVMISLSFETCIIYGCGASAAAAHFLIASRRAFCSR